MTRDARMDAVILALAVSLAIHVGGMFWARPKVMTTVAQGVARAERRAPMRVTEAAELPEPVAIGLVEDREADKAAPGAASAAALIAAPDPEPEAVSAENAPAIEFPEIIARPEPDAKAATMPEADAAPALPLPAPRMDAPTKPPTAPAAPGGFPAAAPGADALPLSPAFSLPAPAAQAMPPPPPPAPATIDSGDDGAKETYVPPAEVMPEVEEAVVEKEKAAVRRLVDVAGAGDISKYVDASVVSEADGGWRHFTLVLKLKEGGLKSVPKDIVVLIDASGSIGRDRMRSIRGAAKGFLRSATNTGDRFNLVAFRDRFSYAFRRWQECTETSFAEADRWLDDVAPHGRTDVFSSVASVLALPRSVERPLIALVITDGEANSGVSDSREIVSRFTALNDGLVSVYMYGVKPSANRELIEELTEGNRGEGYVFDGWRKSAGSGIESFSERFRDPVLTDLRLVFATAARAEARPALLRNLYAGRPVVVSGRVPAAVRELAFSLKGLNGADAYEGYFRLPLDVRDL